MKKLLSLIMLAVLISTYAFAQGVRTKDLPPAGAMQTTDRVVIDRSNTTMLANSPLPVGNLGDLMVNIGSNTYGALARYLGFGIPSNQWSALYIVGDAGAYNAQYIPIREGFGGLLARQMGAAPVYKVINDFSHAFNCLVVENEVVPNPSPVGSSLNTSALINPTATNNPAIVWLPPLGDPTWGGPGGDYTLHLADTSTCTTGGLTWASIAMDYKVYGQNFTNVGTWTNNTHYTLPAGVTSNTNGDTSTGTITTYGGPVYLWYLMNGANGGTFTYQIDGGTASANIPTQGNNQFTFPISTASFSLGAVRIPATGTLAAGSHTIKVTVTSVTSVANTVTVEGIGTSPFKGYSPKAPMVALAGQIPQNTTYPAASAAFNTLYKNISAQLVTDGLIVPFVDVQNYLNNTTGRWNAEGNLNTVGNMQLYQAFSGVLMPVRNSEGAVDPRDFGASCNSMYFASNYCTTGHCNNVRTTAASPTITIDHYTFKPGVATQTGGGDRGKVICIGPGGNSADEGRCTYISTVASDGSSANLGRNMITTTGTHYAVMGGYPSNPADMSTAQTDKTFLEIAGNAAILNGGKLHMPTNCTGADVTFPSNITVEGNGPGAYVIQNPPHDLDGNPFQETVFNCALTGFPSDTQQCFRSATHTLFKNILFQCPTFPFTPQNLSATALGYSVNGTGNGGPSAQVLTENLSFFGCPIDIGSAYGYTMDVGFTATVSDNGDGTSDMNVLSVTTTNFYQADNWTFSPTSKDFLALSRTITAAGGVLGGPTVTITAVAANGNPGHFTINKGLTVSTSTAMTAPRNSLGMELRDHNSQHIVGGIGYNGDFTDVRITDSTCSGTFMNGCIHAVNTGTNFGCGAIRWEGGRMEEMGNAAVTMEGCGIDLTGADLQFNGGYNLKTSGSGAYINMTGGHLYGGGHCSGYFNSMISLGGSTPNVVLNGVTLGTNDFGSGCGGSTTYLFRTATGASTVRASVYGGNALINGDTITGFYDWTNGVPSKYRQDVAGWPRLDTFNVPVTTGLTLTTTHGGIYSEGGLTSTTTTAGTFTLSALPATTTTGWWNCQGGDFTLGNSWPMKASTSTSCSLSATTSNGDSVWWSGNPN